MLTEKIVKCPGEESQLDNLNRGLETLTDECEKLEGASLDALLSLYGNISILIDKSIRDYSNEIAYPAQALLNKVMEELQKRISEKRTVMVKNTATIKGLKDILKLSETLSNQYFDDETILKFLQLNSELLHIFLQKEEANVTGVWRD